MKLKCCNFHFISCIISYSSPERLIMESIFKILAISIFTASAYEIPNNKFSVPKPMGLMKIKKPTTAGIIIGTSLLTSLYRIRPVNADKGSLKVSSLDDTKNAVQTVKKCLDDLAEITQLVPSKDYEKIANILSNPPFTVFENAATILVRSDLITPEDKVSLGTIKRYGVVADAIIMLGGLGAVLRTAGFKVGSEKVNDISDDEEEDDDIDEQKPPVDVNELKKYIKLSKDSLADIYRIVSPILSK